MNLTAITIRQEKTLIASVDVRKNDIKINGLFSTEPFFEDILRDDSTALTNFLQEITVRTKEKSNVIFSIPGSLVKIGFAENVMLKLKNADQTEKAEKEQFGELLKITEPQKYNFSAFTAQKSNKYFTVLGMPKIYVDTILIACLAADIDLSNVSIEPESLAALRFINSPETACCLLEVEKKDAAFSIYDPLRGMLSMALPEASWNNLDGGSGNENISAALAMAEMTATNTFGYKDTPPIYLLSEHDEELRELLNKGQHTAKFKGFKIPNFFQFNEFSADALIKYSPVLGLSQRPLLGRLNKREGALN